MKKIILVLSLLAVPAYGDVTVSAAMKHGLGSQSTTNSSVTGAKVTDNSYAPITSFGALVQATPESFPMSVGVGVFQDQSTLLTLGWRFR